MNKYKLQQDELLASFRPDPAQNRPQQPQTIHQPQFNPPPQHLQAYPPNYLHQPTSNPQPQTFAFSPQEPPRVNSIMDQGEQQAGLPRGNSPPIMITFNEGQRAASPQQGSIVTHIYKPIHQYSYEAKPQSNINQPVFVTQPNGQPPQLVPQHPLPPQPTQQQIVQNQIPVPVGPPQSVQLQQVQQGGQQITIPVNQTGIPQPPPHPQIVPQQGFTVAHHPPQYFVNQHGQIQYIHPQYESQQHIQQQRIVYQGQVQVPAGQPLPHQPIYQTHPHLHPQPVPHPSQPHVVPQTVPQPISQPITQGQPLPQPPVLQPPHPQAQVPVHPQPVAPQPQQRAASESQHQQFLQYQQQQHIKGQEQLIQGQQYPPHPQHYQQGYYPEGQEGAQYEQYPPEYYQQHGYEYPPEYYQQQGYQQYPPEYYEQQQGGQSTLWQERFFYLYQKYEMFYEKYEGMTKEAGFLTEQFLTVDNEEDWLALKEKYDQLVERMGETKQENGLILQEMQENIQQNQKIQNGNQIKEEAGRVWEHRYHQLLEQYESLSHHYAELQSSSMAHNDLDDNERLAMMNEKYARLEAEYNHVVQQLQNSPNSMQSRQEHEDLLKYTQQLQGYIEQLENENNNLVKGMKTSVEGSKMLQHAEFTQKMADKENEIQNLTQMVVSLQERLKQTSENRPKSNISKDVHTSQLENQLQEMSHYCSQIQQKLSMKEYEINGLKDKLGYLEEQLHLKNEETANHSKLLQEKLQRIQNQIANKSQPQSQIQIQPPPQQYYSIEEDYEARIKDYQKAIQTKNGQIRALQERIYECQSEARKLNFEKTSHLRQWQERLDQLEDDFKKKLAQKDGRLRQLEGELVERETEAQRRAQEKDAALRAFETELGKNREDAEGRVAERDQLIKNLKDAAGRLEAELRERNSELSRIRSPNLTPMMRSPNQSFVVENIRYEEELRLQSEQLERRNDQLAKLKKERQQRNKQYRDLQIEYQNLQEENNKRRIELNNLRRQNTTIDNLQLEAETLRATINKRNTEINELKNALFQADRLKMDLDSRAREVERLQEISRNKARQIQQLNERNYQLEEKLRQRDFKLTGLARNDPPPVNRGAQEELLRLQEDLRRKQIDLNRNKLENEELTRSLAREREELEGLKLKLPPKLRQAQEELNDLRLRIATLEKKAAALEGKNRELEEVNKALRSSSAEEGRAEATRLKEYYSKFIDRQEEELKQQKERVRTYELRLHQSQHQIDQLSTRNREHQVFKSEYARKLQALTDKLDAKEEEVRTLRAREAAEAVVLRRKEDKLAEAEAAAKSKEQQVRDLERRLQAQRGALKALKKEYEDYKHGVLEKMEVSTHKEMENLNKQIADYESKVVLQQTNNIEFRLKDKRSNQVFQRRIIYELKQENEFLRRELEGKGVNISLERLKITQMQQEALMKSKHLLAKDDHAFAQEIAFYKEKNKELQERVNNHIAVNKNLRDRLEYLLEENGKYEQLDKLKLRLIELESRDKDSQEKIARLLEENKAVRRENNNLNINTSASQDYQLALQELNKEFAQTTLARNSIQQELTVVKVQLQNAEGQCKELQKQVGKLTNQNNILKSEIQRLKESKSVETGKNSNEQVKQLAAELANKTEQLQRASNDFQSLQRHIQELEDELRLTKQQRHSSSEQLVSLPRAYEEIDNWKQRVSQLEALLHEQREDLAHLEQQCQFYKSQGAQQPVREEAFYYLELLRNNSIEVESLASEVGLESERMALLVERLAENSRRSLQSCQYLHEILS